MTTRPRISDRKQDWFDWYGLLSGSMFLGLSTLMCNPFVFLFESIILIRALAVVALTLAILTVIFGLVTVPRWQGWIAIGVFAYAIYWVFFMPIYGITVAI